MLSYNVAALLRSVPGTVESHHVALANLDIADDIRLAGPIEGDVRLSRTGRSVLVRADLSTAMEGICGRCLTPVVTPIEVQVEEEALPSIDIDTGLPVDRDSEPDALRLDDHHELDLENSVREQISLAEPIAVLCRPDCRGLCPDCGLDLNDNPGHSHTDQPIDPRLAALAAWRNRYDKD